MHFARLAAPVFVSFVTLAAGSALASVSVPRGTPLPFAWTEPPGGADAYMVYVDCNDGERLIAFRIAQPSVVIYSYLCDTLQLSVAGIAAGSTDQLGPSSDPSEAVSITGTAGTLPGPGGLGTPQDFDGDGRSDLLVRDLTDAGLHLWLPRSGSDLEVHDLPASGSEVVGSADLNADGVADLLLLDGETRELRAWLMAGGFPFAEAPLGVLPLPWIVASQGDHDGDGRADILLQDPSTGDLERWLMKDLDPFAAAPLNLAAAPGLSLRASADFNGDRRADLLWHDAGTGAVEIWTLDDDSVASTTAIPGAFPAGWELAAVADVTADGLEDLVWHDRTTNEVVIWPMQAGGPAEELVIDLPGEPRRSPLAAGDYDGDGRPELLLSDRADADGDGGIGTQDFFSWREEFKAVDCSASGCFTDFNGDGSLGLPDFLVWRQQFDGTVPARLEALPLEGGQPRLIGELPLNAAVVRPERRP